MNRLRIAVMAACCFVAVPAVAQTLPPIKLGALASLTGGGALNGAAMVVATRMAIADLNAAGGILGRKVELVMADDQSDPTQAVNEAKRLVFQEKVHLIVGPNVSQETLAILPTLTEGKVFNVSQSGSALLTPQVGPYHFSLQPSAEAQGVGMAKHALDIAHAKAPALLVDNGANSKTSAVAMRAYLESRGVSVVGQQEFPFKASDLTPQLLSLKRANPDMVLFVATIPDDVVTMLRGRQDLGWNIPVVGTNAITTFANVVLKMAGREAFTNVAGQSFTGFTYCASDTPGTSDYAKFLTKLKAFAPEESQKVAVTTVGWDYASIMLMKDVAEGAGSLDASKMAAWLEANADKLKSMAGPLSASKDTHFLLGPNATVMAEHPEDIRSDGLLRRSGC